MDLQEWVPDRTPSCKVNKHPSDQNHFPQITSPRPLSGISVQVSTGPNPSIQSERSMAKDSHQPILFPGMGFYGKFTPVTMLIQLGIFIRRCFPTDPFYDWYGLFLHPTEQIPSSPEGMAYSLKPDVRRMPHKPQTPVRWAGRTMLSENGC